MKSARQSIQAPSPMRWITHAAFVVALAVVIARLTTLDALREPLEIAPGSDVTPSMPGPGTALVFDLLACLPGLLILIRRAVDRSYRLTMRWSHPLLLALAGWAVLSTAWSADRFAAAVTSAHFFTAGCLLWAMSQLVRSAVRLRLVCALAFGLLLVLVVQSVLYRFMDVPETINYWNEHKTKILIEQNWTPDSFAARRYEQKVMSGEMQGFFASPNTFAAVGVLLFFACVGIGVQKLRDREPPGWLVLPAIAALSLVWILINARSKTAAATPVLGIGVLGTFFLLRHRLTRAKHWMHFWIGVGLVAFGMVAVVGHGLQHHGLFPGHFSNSLDFRWKYWVASAGIFVTHPWIGVGWSNFGLHYLAHRLPEAAEEIKDPHNVLVRFFVELGVVGGLLCIAWLLRLAWEITVAARICGDSISPPLCGGEPRQSRGLTEGGDEPITIKSAAAIVILGMVLSIAANVDFTMAAGDTLALLLKPLLYLLALLLGTMAAAMLSQHSWSLDERPAPWIFCCMVTGLGLFLLHNLIDFSWFEPGAMFLFMALVGSALGMSPVENRPARSRALAIAGTAAGIFCWLAAAIFFVAPILIAEQSSAEANELIRTATGTQDSETASHFRRAAEALATASQQVPYNEDYVFRQAEACIRLGDLDRAKALIARAKQINPMLVDAYLLDANVQLLQPNPDAAVVREDFTKILQLNPNDVSLHVQFGDALARFGLLSEAREQYRMALSVDGALPIDEPKRLSPDQEAELRAKAGLAARLKPL